MPPARRIGWRCAACIAGALLALLAANAAGASVRSYRNAAWRIAAFDVPRGFTPARHVPWPGVLLVASGTAAAGAGGARLVLAAQRVAVGRSPSALAADAGAVLSRRGYTVVRVVEQADAAEPRAQLDATFNEGRELLRQVYVIAGDAAIIVTLSAPVPVGPHALRAFDAAVASLEVVADPFGATPPPPLDPPPPASATDPPAPTPPAPTPPAPTPPAPTPPAPTPPASGSGVPDAAPR